MRPSSDRRRVAIVDRRFQIGITLKIAFYLGGYLALFCAVALLAPFLVLVSSQASEEAVLAAARDVSGFFRNLIWPVLLTFACLALHTILLSHRIAGPIFRLRRTFEAMEDGDLAVELRLRHADYFADLAASFNTMLYSVRADLEAVREEARALVEEARRTDGADDDGRESLARRGARILDLLDRYRLSGKDGGSVDRRQGPARRVASRVGESL